MSCSEIELANSALQLLSIITGLCILGISATIAGKITRKFLLMSSLASLEDKDFMYQQMKTKIDDIHNHLFNGNKPKR